MQKNALFAALAAAGIFAGTLNAAEPTAFERFEAKVDRIQAEHGIAPEDREKVEVIGRDGSAAQPAKEVRPAAPAPEAKEMISAEEAIEAVENDPAKKLAKMVDLNVRSAQALAAEDGSILIMLGNGRFVVEGKILDIWQQKRLRTIEEIEDAVKRVDLTALGYELWDYADYKIGTGKKKSVIFVDAKCGWCHRMLKSMLADEALLKDYRFDVHVIPALGPESNELAKKLFCQVETDPTKRLKAMLGGPEVINALPQREKCNRAPHDRTLMMAKLLNIHSVPFVIAPDGRFSIGMPSDMRDFLEGTVKPKPKKAQAKASEEKAAPAVKPADKP